MRHGRSWCAHSAALLILLAAGTGACGESESDNLGTARLTVVGLSEQVQGWRLRAEVSAPDMDGSPTFYFSDSEEVVGSSMTSAEITVGARSYALVVRLADRSTGETRFCEADVAIAGGQSLALEVEAESIAEASPGEPPPQCSLESERGRSV